MRFLKTEKKKIKVKENNFGSGALWKFSQTVGSARFGAVTHPGAKKEKKKSIQIFKFIHTGIWSEGLGNPL